MEDYITKEVIPELKEEIPICNQTWEHIKEAIN